MERTIEESGPPEEDTLLDWVRPWVLVGILVLVATLAGSALLSVNLFPVITPDSVLYLDHSQNLAEQGLITYGYRQAGYPLFLAVWREITTAVGFEPLLGVAVLQRLMLVAGGALAWWLWRWWSLPYLTLLLAAETLAYTNFVLVEGWSLPFATLLVIPTFLGLRTLAQDNHDLRRGFVTAMASLVAAGIVILYGFRFTHVVFAVVPIIFVVAAWRSTLRRSMLVVLAVFILAMSSITIALSLENAEEQGVFFPTANAEATQYYYAWMQVFRVNPENQLNPDLARFWDDGFVHHFSRGTVTIEDKDERIAAYSTEVEAMLTAAGMSVRGSQVQSMLWALAGGRLEDVAGAVDLITSTTRHDIDRVMHLNSFVEDNGAPAFELQYNEGRTVEPVITDPIGLPFPVPSNRRLVAILLPLALVVQTVGLRPRTTRWIAASGLLVVLAQAVGLGLLRADNFRFLVTGAVYGIGLGTGVLVELVRSRQAAARSESAAGQAPSEDVADDSYPEG